MGERKKGERERVSKRERGGERERGRAGKDKSRMREKAAEGTGK